MWSALIAPISGLLSGILDKIFPDPVKREEVRNQMLGELLKADWSLVEKQAEIILAEAQGESWLQRNWRPLLMLCAIGIVANNYIVFPYLSMFTSKATVLILPEWLWDLLKIGVGGYIAGRSAEKIVESWKGGGGK